MLKAFLNIFRVAELRNKIFFTIAMLVIYRIGWHIPLPGVDQGRLAEWAEKAGQGAGGNILAYMSIFTGGSLSQSTIFALGVMPYISAAIIFQLLTTILPALKKLQEEGPAGRQKIQEYTRYATVGLCLIQAVMLLIFLLRSQLIYPEYARGFSLPFWGCGVLGLTAGSVFLMWLGEQIDKYGIGNGVSLIITAGILAGMPGAIGMVISDFSMSGTGTAAYGPDTVLFLIIAFVVVVAGSIVITQGQRRIPIQQAKHTRGRRVFGGQKTYLPLRVNHGGVMPIIFASSLMIFPTSAINWLASTFPQSAFLGFLNQAFAHDGYPYILSYIALIYFFAYFWTTVQFQPSEVAKQLRDHGSFIPGLRPGPRTAEYLETVMERITYCGAGFLSLIAVVPSIVSAGFGIDFMVTQFLGGTGLLITVSVMLDLVQRVEANLMMRNYEGFLSSSGKGPRIRGRRG